MLEKWKSVPDKGSIKLENPSSKLGKYSLEERGGYFLAIGFLTLSTWSYFLIRQTLIPLLTASQIFLGIGLVGFVLAFLFRKSLNIGVLDGLYYNAFLIAPLCFSGLLWYNTQCVDYYTEQYNVIKYNLHGSSYSFELENKEYDEYWRIRTMQIESRPARSAHIEFTFCDGKLGYKVLKDTRLF